MSPRPKRLSVAKHRTGRPRGICLALFLIFGAYGQSFAQTNDTYREGEEWFDRYQAVVSERVQTAALRLDEWLSGDARDTAAQSDTLLRARLTLQIDESQWVRIRPAISGHLALPAFQKRARLFADNIARGVLPGVEEERTDRETFRTGLRFDLYRALRSLLSWEFGVKLSPLPVVFTTLDASYSVPVGRWRLTLNQQGYWYSDDGFGETSEMDWDYPLATNLAFRSITAAVWSETSKGVEFEQTGRLTWSIFPKKRYLSLSATALAHKSGEGVFDNWRLSATYSTVFVRPWLFLDFTPQADYPREQSFEFTPSLRVSLSAYFGDLR